MRIRFVGLALFIGAMASVFFFSSARPTLADAAKGCVEQGGTCTYGPGATCATTQGQSAVSSNSCQGGVCCVGTLALPLNCTNDLGGHCSVGACAANETTYSGGTSCGTVNCCQPNNPSGAPTGGATGGTGKTPGGAGGCTGASGFPDPLCGADIPTIVSRLVTSVLGITGGLFFVMFLWGGVTWMMAAGDAKQTQAATKMLTNAVIGLGIVALSYVLVFNIINIIVKGAG